LKRKDLCTADVGSLVRDYIAAAIIHGDATLTRNFRKGNPKADLLFSIYRELRNRGREAQNALLVLLNHPNDSVRSWAASHVLEFSPEDAVPVLEKLSMGKGLVNFGAKMTLDEWRRKGRLNFFGECSGNTH
jgi:hypothetical protein